jgi:hypothetical protein
MSKISLADPCEAADASNTEVNHEQMLYSNTDFPEDQEPQREIPKVGYRKPNHCSLWTVYRMPLQPRRKLGNQNDA